MACDLHIFDDPNGGFLSFDISDAPLVIASIQARYGAPQKAQNIMWLDLEFGGCKFTYDEEYDDMFIMTGSDEGIEILKLIHSDLTTFKRPNA